MIIVNTNKKTSLQLFFRVPVIASLLLVLFVGLFQLILPNKSAQANTDSSLMTSDDSIYYGRYLNPDTDVSIFATCYEKTTPYSQRVVFGYANKTSSPFLLTSSTIPAGRRAWNNPSPHIRLLDEKARILELVDSRSREGRVDAGREEVFGNHSQDDKTLSYIDPQLSSWMTPPTNPNFWQWQVSVPQELYTGEVEFAFAVENYSTEDTLWSIEYHPREEESHLSSYSSSSTVIRKARANKEFLPECNEYIKAMKAITSQSSLANSKHFNEYTRMVEREQTQVSSLPFLTVSCSSFDTDEDGKQVNRYSTRFGYTNPLDARIALSSSTLFERSGKPIRDVVHSHLSYDDTYYRDNGIPFEVVTRLEGDIEIRKPEVILSETSLMNSFVDRSIPYLLPGTWNHSMTVGGYSTEDIIWTVTLPLASNSGNHTFISPTTLPLSHSLKVRANPLYDEPCPESVRKVEESVIPEITQIPSQEIGFGNSENGNGSSQDEKEALVDQNIVGNTDQEEIVPVQNNQTKATKDDESNQQINREDTLIAQDEFNQLHSSKRLFLQSKYQILSQSPNTFGGEIVTDPSPLESKYLNYNYSTPLKSSEYNFFEQNGENDLSQEFPSSPLIAFLEQETNNQIEEVVPKLQPISLGGVNLESYCKEVFGDYYSLHLGGNKNRVTDWYCRSYKAITSEDMTTLCRQQYARNNDSRVHTPNSSDPFSLVCIDYIYGFNTNRVLGGLDLSRHCQQQGIGHTLTLNGSTTSDWGCERKMRIDFDGACQMQYRGNEPLPVAVDTQPQSPYGLECHQNVESTVPPSLIDSNNGDSIVTPSLSLTEILENEIRKTTYSPDSSKTYNLIIEEVSEAQITLIRQINEYTVQPVLDWCSSLSLPIALTAICFGGSIHLHTRLVYLYLTAHFILGARQGLVDLPSSIIEGAKSLPEVINLLFTLSNQINDEYYGSKELYFLHQLYRLYENRTLMSLILAQSFDHWSSLSLEKKFYDIGYFIGQFIPDIAVFVAGFFTNGTTWSVFVSRFSSFITTVLTKVDDMARGLGLAGLLMKITKGILRLTSSISLTLRLVGNKLTFISQEIIDNISRYGDDFIRLVERILPEEQVDELRRYRETLVTCGSNLVAVADSSSQAIIPHNILASFTTFINGVSVEAKGGICGTNIVNYNNGYKHYPSKTLSWKDIVDSTKNGPAKYKPDINIPQIEETALNNYFVSNKNYYYDAGYTIGASEGKETSYIQIYISGNTYHGRPILKSRIK